jgi:hypothetical protein
VWSSVASDELKFDAASTAKGSSSTTSCSHSSSSLDEEAEEGDEEVFSPFKKSP